MIGKPAMSIARLTLALAACALAACSRPRGGASGEPAPPQVRLHGVRVRYYQGESLVAISRAARVTYQRDSSDFSADEAYVRFEGHGQLSGRAGNVEVRAVRMEGNLAAKAADGLEGVTLKTGSGLAGETQRAHFDGVARQASGHDPVSVWGPGYWLDAHGFHFRLEDEQIEFGDGVESRLGAGR